MTLTSNPILVVGQPRSGSTILTRVLNEAEGAFVVNDFYVLQKIDSLGLWGTLNSEQAKQLAKIIFERLEIRVTQEAGKTLEQSITLENEDVDALRALAIGDWPEETNWAYVMDRLMSTAAKAAGCDRWGWNTPQDYHHLGRIFEAFPQAKAVFLLRKPAAVLSSYKNASGPWHEARRYNPIAIGLAWRNAARSYLSWSKTHSDQVMFMRYDDLVGQTAENVGLLGAFFDLSFPPVDLASFGKNSSFAAGSSPKVDVTGTELVITERLLSSELEALEFQTSGAGMKLSDAGEVIRVFARSGSYLVSTLAKDKDRRMRVLRLVGLKK